MIGKINNHPESTRYMYTLQYARLFACVQFVEKRIQFMATAMEAQQQQQQRQSMDRRERHGKFSRKAFKSKCIATKISNKTAQEPMKISKKKTCSE